MEIKTILRFHISPVRMAVTAANTDEEKVTRNPLYTAGGGLSSPAMVEVWRLLSRLKGARRSI